jgi:hypothetical protein
MSAGGFKVKISDGSVVGPLDVDMVRSWYQQGLIDRDTPVLPPNARAWCKFSDAFDIGSAGGGSKGKGKSKGKPSVDEVDDDGGYETGSSGPSPRFGRLLAAGVLIAGAVGAIAALLTPGAWRADLSPAPWRELGYVQLLLGLVALHDSEWSRRIARTGVCLFAFCVFPAIGFAIAQGVALDAYLVLGSAWLLTSGLFFLLAPAMPWSQLAASLLAVVVGAYGILRFGIVMGAATITAAM